MITEKERNEISQWSQKILEKSGLPLSATALSTLEVADFGLSHVRVEGAQIYTIFQTERMACKLLVLLPNQVEPEHWHPYADDDPGKEEVLTGQWGDLLVYLPGGGDTANVEVMPKGKDDVYTCRDLKLVKPGDSLVLPPGTKHWFAAGSDGAVFFSTATVARYLEDRFTDPKVVRKTVVEG